MEPRFAYILGLVCLLAGVALEFVGVATGSRWAALGGVAFLVVGTAVIATRVAQSLARYLPGLACLAVGGAAALFAGPQLSLLWVGIALIAIGAAQTLFAVFTRPRS